MKIVLSLYDGMSCGQLALQRAGIKVDYYLASEVDKAAITVATKNWPDMVHLGDVREIEGDTIVSPFILMGGSPCQSFSFAGKKVGMTTELGEEVTTLERYLELKAEGFKFSGQSYLFWEYVRILKETKPRYFLLENVRMAKKWERVISETMGVDPVGINSALVSAQNRKRLYWTNITGVSQPEDRGVMLEDVLHVSPAQEGPVLCGAIRGRYVPGVLGGKAIQCLEPNFTGKTNALTTVGKDNVYLLSRVEQGVKYLPGEVEWRGLTPVECERLQTVPEGYTEGVPDTQRYKMLGNGWTVDVIAHILSHIPEEER